MKRVWASCAVLLALLAAAFLLWPRPGPGVSQPAASTTAFVPAPHPCNVLLLVIDTLRANRLSCYGYPRPTSPNIDRLASRGTLYRNNHSQSCWTLTSMISMMTGKSMIAEAKSLPSSVPSLSSVLHDQGLETAAFIANPVVGKASGFGRSFDVFEECEGTDALVLAELFSTWYANRTRTIEAEPERRKFFAWVHFIDPHQPYDPDPLHDVFHGPRPDESLLLPRWREALPRVPELSPGFVTPSFEDCIAHMTKESNRYDGEVRAVDDAVGRILSELEHSGDLGDTLVIVCSDHGEMLYEHQVQPLMVRKVVEYWGGLSQGVADLFGCGHRPWFYEDLWNTPLILAGPGMLKGVERSGMSANLDIFPTCLEALQIARPPGLEGVSLWRGIEPVREEVYAYGQGTSAVFERSRKKLILSPRSFYFLGEDQPEPLQLFDLTRDPHEENDIAKTDPREAARMLRKIEEWYARSTRGWSGTYTPAQLHILHRLGYTGDDE